MIEWHEGFPKPAMEQNRTKLTLLNLAALLMAGGAGLAIARATHALSGQVALCFLALGFLVTLVAYFQMRLVERERLERLEFDELTKSPSASALFNKGEGAALPARRSREQFERFFVPGFTIVLMLGEAAGVFLLWRWLSTPGIVPMEQPLLAVVVFGLFALILFLLGRFSVTLARLEKQRLLQPVASFVLANAYLCAAVSLAIIAAYAGAQRADPRRLCGSSARPVCRGAGRLASACFRRRRHVARSRSDMTRGTQRTGSEIRGSTECCIE